jgi:hypothetical protein
MQRTRRYGKTKLPVGPMSPGLVPYCSDPGMVWLGSYETNLVAETNWGEAHGMDRLTM